VDTIVVEFKIAASGETHDLEIPKYIKVIDLIRALNTAYSLNIDMSQPEQLYLQTEEPAALLMGDHTLEKFGLHNGTKLIFAR